MTRRGFVLASGLAVLGALTARTSRGLEAAGAAAAPVLRPSSVGSSAGRCAHCGSLTHSTLDPACRRAVETRRALQSAARRVGEHRGRAGG